MPLPDLSRIGKPKMQMPGDLALAPAHQPVPVLFTLPAGVLRGWLEACQGLDPSAMLAALLTDVLNARQEAWGLPADAPAEPFIKRRDADLEVSGSLFEPAGAVREGDDSAAPASSPDALVSEPKPEGWPGPFKPGTRMIVQRCSPRTMREWSD